MARRQGAAGGRRAPPSVAVVVHDLAQARAALAAAAESGTVTLLVSAPGVAAFAGVGFLRALEEQAGAPLVADCGEDAGLVMEALRAGLRDVLFTGDERLRRPLAEMAEAVGGRLRARLGPRVVWLEPGEEPAERLA